MKGHSRFYSSLGLLIILNLVVKPVWIFGIDRQVQNAVGTTAYGTYFSLLNLSIVFSFLLDWGLTAFFNRQLAAQQKEFTEKTGSFLLVKLLFAVAYIAIILVAGWLSGIRYTGILLNVALIQVFTSLFLFFRSIITARQWFRTDAWLSVLDKTLMILLCGSFLYFPLVFGIMTIHKFLFAQLACTLLAMICSLVILLRRGVEFSIGRNPLPGKEIFYAALPFAIVFLLMAIHYRLDGFLLERIHPAGAYEAGIYAGAYRLLDAANMAGYLFASFLLPYLARRWSNKLEIEAVVLAARHVLLTYSIFIAAAVFFLAPWIQTILYHQDLNHASVVLKWCLPALIGYSLVHIYGTVMVATGQVIKFCWFAGIAVIINTGLNLLLIPVYGATGSAIAAIASQLACGLAAMLYVSWYHEIRLHYRSLLLYIFTALALSVFFYRGASVLHPWLLLALGGMITLLILAVTFFPAIRTGISSFRKSPGSF